MGKSKVTKKKCCQKYKKKNKCCSRCPLLEGRQCATKKVEKKSKKKKTKLEKKKK